jgi:hypothetical protein
MGLVGLCEWENPELLESPPILCWFGDRDEIGSNPFGVGIHQAARSLLGLQDPDSPFVKSELKRLNAEMKSLGDSIRSLESGADSTRAVELSEVTKALQQLDPVWEVLYPEEQSRVLELLVESVTVSKHSVDIHFRANGIEQIVDELTPMSERTDG